MEVDVLTSFELLSNHTFRMQIVDLYRDLQKCPKDEEKRLRRPQFHKNVQVPAKKRKVNLMIMMKKQEKEEQKSV